jgi:hypothetical protein
MKSKLGSTMTANAYLSNNFETRDANWDIFPDANRIDASQKRIENLHPCFETSNAR